MPINARMRNRGSFRESLTANAASNAAHDQIAPLAATTAVLPAAANHATAEGSTSNVNGSATSAHAGKAPTGPTGLGWAFNPSLRFAPVSTTLLAADAPALIAGASVLASDPPSGTLPANGVVLDRAHIGVRAHRKMTTAEMLKKSIAARTRARCSPSSVDTFVGQLMSQRATAAKAAAAKKPPRAMKSMKAMKRASSSMAMRAMKSPKARVKTSTLEVLPKPRNCPAPPTQGNPIKYNTGTMYLVKGFYRCIRVSGNYGTEIKKRIDRFSSPEQAFYHGLKAIDDYPGVDVD